MGSSWDRGHFMKNFHFDTIRNITQEPYIGLWVHRQVCCHKILLSKVNCINEKSRFDQLATASSTTPSLKYVKLLFLILKKCDRVWYFQRTLQYCKHISKMIDHACMFTKSWWMHYRSLMDETSNERTSRK